MNKDDTVNISAPLKYGSDGWWQSQIQKGITWRDKKGWSHRWEDIRKYYSHEFSNPLDPHFNLIYMLASSLIPSLVFQRPSVINTARRPEFIYWASFFDSIDNWVFEQMCIEDTIEDAVLECFLYNTCAFQLGYDFIGEDISGKKEMTFDKIPGVLDSTRKTNLPWVDMVPIDRMILSPGTKDMRTCRWFAKFLSLPVRRMKELPGFKHVEATHVSEDVARSQDNKWMEDEAGMEGYCNFYEIHNAEDGTWLCMDTRGKIIRKPEEDPLQISGLPFEVLSFNKTSRCIFGTPDALYIETQMLEGDECRRDGRLQRKVALVKFLYDKGCFREEDIEKLLTGNPMIGIGVDMGPNSDQALGNKILLLQPHVQMEYHEYEKQLLNDAQLLTGTGPNQFGTFAPGRRTKFETQVVEERNLLRTGSRRQKIADLLGKIASRINMLVVKNWKAPIVKKVIGVDGALHWVEALPTEFQEINSQLVTTVNVESLAPASRDRMRQEFVDLLGVLRGMEGVDIMPLLQAFLSTFPYADIAKVLPQAQSGVQSMEKFQEQQQQMSQEPGIGKMAANNLQAMGQLINKMPAGAGKGGE